MVHDSKDAEVDTQAVQEVELGAADCRVDCRSVLSGGGELGIDLSCEGVSLADAGGSEVEVCPVLTPQSHLRCE